MQTSAKLRQIARIGLASACLTAFFALSGCNSLPQAQDAPQGLQYLGETPEPDAPLSPVTNAGLAQYALSFKYQLKACNADKRSLYELLTTKE